MSFEDLGLSADILRAVNELGYSNPTPIQAKAIPTVLQGHDVLAGAQTGTGKTAGFTLPLLHLLAKQSLDKRKPRALILTPTRELAAQVGDNVRAYSKYLPIRSAVIFGGVKINPQIEKIRRGVDVLVATPGRLLDHIQQKTVDLSSLEILVLDEADRMLDMGFIRDIRKIMRYLPQQRQNLLFSATYSNEIKLLADSILTNPEVIEVARRNTTSEQVTQKVHMVDRQRKRALLSFLVGSNNWQQVLVFTRTKHGANRLSQQLEQDGIPASAIHGNKSQGARTRALSQFKNGTIQVLVATDIAARGLDINELPHVVNFELPNVAEDYVHRIGRTGRAGNNGEAISLVCVDEHKLLKNIERLVKRKLPQEVIEGFEPDPSIKPEPIPNGRNGNHQAPKSGQRRATNSATGNRRQSADGNDRGRGNSSKSAKPHHHRQQHDSRPLNSRKQRSGNHNARRSKGNSSSQQTPALLSGND